MTSVGREKKGRGDGGEVEGRIVIAQRISIYQRERTKGEKLLRSN